MVLVKGDGHQIIEHKGMVLLATFHIDVLLPTQGDEISYGSPSAHRKKVANTKFSKIPFSSLHLCSFQDNLDYKVRVCSFSSEGFVRFTSRNRC